MAIIYLNKALEMDSSKTDLYRDLAMTYNKSKKFNEAVTYFEIAIAKAKRPMIADYFLLGRACYFAKQFGKADTAFIKVSDLKPDYAEAYLWRGNTNANIDPDAKTTVAKDMYEKYIVLAEPNADKNKINLITSYMYMATYFIKKDDSKTAREYLNKVTTLDPANETAQKYLKQLK
jgi:tetratricopeptide (TPR) repeat protein